MKIAVKGLIKLFFALSIILILGQGVIAQDDERPRLRIIHASPEIQKVDIYVGETLYFRNIYFTYVSDYVPITAGTPPLSSRLPGAGFNLPPLFEHTFTYENNKDYTVVAAGRLLNNQRWTWLLEDDNELPGEGTAKVRIVHAAFESPTTDFCLADVCYTLAFQENSGYFLLDPGVYMPKVHVNGTGITYIETPPLKLKDNSVHTIFMVGQIQSQEGLKLIYTLDAGDLPEKGGPPPLGVPSGPPAHYYVPPQGAPDLPAPAYPPVTGSLLSPQLQAIAAVAILLLVGGLGFWIIRLRASA
jgi:hypothetical protein